MIETAVHITKRRNPSGKICYTVRWFQDGRYRGHAGLLGKSRKCKSTNDLRFSRLGKINTVTFGSRRR